ncbi:MAG: DUF4292 domain-containing protein [Flavobacteriaceae bacterium]
MRVFLIFFLIIGCSDINKPRKNISKRKLSSSAASAITNSNSDRIIKEISIKKLITEIKKKSPNFNYISYKSIVSVRNKSSKSQFNVSIKIKDQEKILLTGSLIIPVFKALLTQEKISFYEKINKTYFKGDYMYLSSILKNNVSLKNIQNILVGRPMISIDELKFKQLFVENNYIIYGELKKGLSKVQYNFDPFNFKLLNQSISNKQEKLEIAYSDYVSIEGQLLPKNLKIILKSKDKTTSIVVDLRISEFGSELSFPFKIPAGYKSID